MPRAHGRLKERERERERESCLSPLLSLLFLVFLFLPLANVLFASMGAPERRGKRENQRCAHARTHTRTRQMPTRLSLYLGWSQIRTTAWTRPTYTSTKAQSVRSNSSAYTQDCRGGTYVSVRSSVVKRNLPYIRVVSSQSGYGEWRKVEKEGLLFILSSHSVSCLSGSFLCVHTVLKEREAGYEEGENIAYRVCSTCSVKAGWLARPSVRPWLVLALEHA